MMKNAWCLCLVAACGLDTRAADMVTVTLVGGSRVTAPLLRRNDDGVVLDLGHDVLQIPAKRLLDVRSEAPEAEAGGEQQHDIFRTGRLEARDVPELVKQFGEAVVMVRNPGGLGTGFLISRDGHLVTNYHVVENNTRLQVTLRSRPAGLPIANTRSPTRRSSRSLITTGSGSLPFVSSGSSCRTARSRSGWSATILGLAFGIPANELIDFLVHRDTYPYDESQPQNGVTYLPPPFQPAPPVEGARAVAP